MDDLLSRWPHLVPGERSQRTRWSELNQGLRRGNQPAAVERCDRFFLAPASIERRRVRDEIREGLEQIGGYRIPPNLHRFLSSWTMKDRCVLPSARVWISPSATNSTYSSPASSSVASSTPRRTFAASSGDSCSVGPVVPPQSRRAHNGGGQVRYMTTRVMERVSVFGKLSVPGTSKAEPRHHLLRSQETCAT